LGFRDSPARLMLALLASVFLAGCKVGFSLPPDGLLQLSIHETGQPVYARPLKENDPARLAIGRWLASNPDGWEYGFITRPPQVYLEGKGFSINITKDEVLLKYCRASYNCHYWIKKNSALFSELRSLSKQR